MAIVYQEMSPPAPDHMEELLRNQSTTPVDTQPPGSLTTSSDEPHREVTSLVTKSLSALKSRKEQIIGKGPSLYYVSIFLVFFWPTHFKMLNQYKYNTEGQQTG